MSRLENSLKQHESWTSQVSDLKVLIQLGLEEGDESLAAEVAQGLDRLNKELETYEFTRLLCGEYDDSAAIVTINAGAATSNNAPIE